MIIRKASKKDLEGVFEIEKNAFAPDNYPIFVLRQYMDVFPKLFLIATDQHNAILGYVIGGIDESKNIGWILSLATNPDNKSKGVGSRLTNELIKKFQTLHLDIVRLTVHPENIPANKLYEKLGFSKKELDHNYYGDQSPRLILDLNIS